MIKQEPSFSISLIQEKISRDFGFKISYRKAWKAKQKAIVKIFGDWDESYAILPRWLDYMQSLAQGSMYEIETKDFEVGNQVDNRFQVFHRLFWTFKQCCDAFKYCKPIIQVDGTFLYGKYRGTLLIATTQDGNCCVLPIAFAIVEGETLEAWTWFLANIRQHVTQKQGICFISNQHQSIESVVANEHLGWQPPHAYHVYCIRHIANNFDNKFKNVKLKNDLFKLGYMTSKIYFDRNLEKFRQTSPEIASWIDTISKEKWSIAYDEEGRRYGHMTTNLPETVNKILKGARNLPITALVKCTYSRLVEYFVQKGSQARAELSAGNRFCKKLLDAIQKNQEEACSFKVRTHDVILNMFEVEEIINPAMQMGSRLVSVDLCKRTCQCGKFTAYRFPCSHVIAACAHADIDFYQYVDPIYSIQNIVDTYSAQWSPIGNEESIPPASGPRLVPNVETVRAKGRPKSTRIRNEMDLVESHPRHNKCGYCKQVGHSRRTCPSHPDH
ncbi:uncharacterized protein LOC133297529 [Gastrolobium bilobum]|uniref:uncharacterized protein LOC133297529 n=1 Tax=Gastrolobium bilobum TaxID=150636 RepID=UPI002AB1FDDF|nr:uncharacterized protein LOC133297529 [Gastrolobium bilobum]XP_061352682.1 uncharacterized protein LOC133297529 [Gastrolobium bilobum]XP_061352683.1 uncharacterized protein LOC133297529 [Gastrolobium bilobum]